MSINGVNAYKE